MKSNFSLKFKLFDIFIVAFVMVAIIASIITTNVVFSRDLKDDYVVQIYYQGELLEDKRQDHLPHRHPGKSHLHFQILIS